MIKHVNFLFLILSVVNSFVFIFAQRVEELRPEEEEIYGVDVGDKYEELSFPESKGILPLSDVLEFNHGKRFYDVHRNRYGLLDFQYFDFYYQFLASNNILLIFLDIDWNHRIIWLSTIGQNGIDLSTFNIVNSLNSVTSTFTPQGVYLMKNLLLDMKVFVNFYNLAKPIEEFRFHLFYFY